MRWPTTFETAESRIVQRVQEALRLRRIRSMAEFAEQEIVVPTGPLAGLPFRLDRQPAQRLYLEAAGDRRWRRIVATAPQQAGKTLAFFVIPTLWHLFEVGERVIWGVPDKNLAALKWESDLYPVIAESPRLRHFLPSTGEGSKGGRIESNVRFGNGADLVVMSAGGSDKSRASVTGRVVVITETDGLDTAQRTSVEADPIEQIVGRTRAYADSRVYMECTVSVEKGRTWREYQGGSESRVAIPCVHCEAWVTPEREHLRGWQGAESITEAREKGRLCCPSCGAEWTEDERRQSNLRGRLVHRGQDIDSAGEVTGDPPKTDTLGFRFNAANNLIVPMSEAAAAEWDASRDPDDEEGDTRMRQWYWVMPAKGGTSSKAQTIASRLGQTARGIVPDWATLLTIGIDVGLHRCQWVAQAWGDRARGHVIDYGDLYVPSDSMAAELAVLVALREFRDGSAEKGWGRAAGGEPMLPQLVLVDSGYLPDSVYQFAKESGTTYMPSKGQGVSQYGSGGRYLERKSTGARVSYVGDGYHVSRLAAAEVDLLELDVDRWKTIVHRRFTAPIDADGSTTLFRVTKSIEHQRYIDQLLAEERVEEYVAGKGTITRWRKDRGPNHFLDATVLSTVAGHACGVRLIGSTANEPPPPSERQAPQGITTPDGREFLAVYRSQT